MAIGILKTLFGSRNDRLLKQYRKVVLKVNALESTLQSLDDAALQAKTAEFKSVLSNLNLLNEKVLMIVGAGNDNVYLSSRNLQRVKVVSADSVNTYDVLNAKKVVLTESSIEVIEKILN